MQGSKNIFVFVVCGTREHIDTLHYSLRALKLWTRNNIVVITDTTRNEIAIEHENIVDVKTPQQYNHHQASIYLKTGIHKLLPPENNYCYLDTDVVALDEKVDEIFGEFKAPIIFANDHCPMDKFSPSAVKCGCIGKYKAWETELKSLFVKYEHLTRPAENEEKKEALLLLFDKMKKNRLRYALVSLRFWLSPRIFKLHSDAFLHKQKRAWLDKDAQPILYEDGDNAVEAIEANSNFRCDKANNYRWTIDGHDVFDCRCNHLQQQIATTFGIKVEDPNWQHWNGGVFLFNARSHAFLNAWHEKTMQIFTLAEWNTRDQGTLIATVWQFNLQNHATLPVTFNLIADYNHLTMQHKGQLFFDINEQCKNVKPHFIHVYHHWGDKQWDVWQDVEKQTGISIA